MNMPSQICCLSEFIKFSDNCEQAIKKGKLANYKQDLQRQVEGYTGLDTKGDGLILSKVKALILDILHNADVVDSLVKDQVQNPGQWTWHKQLKYRLD